MDIRHKDLIKRLMNSGNALYSSLTEEEKQELISSYCSNNKQLIEELTGACIERRAYLFSSMICSCMRKLYKANSIADKGILIEDILTVISDDLECRISDMYHDDVCEIEHEELVI